MLIVHTCSYPTRRTSKPTRSAIRRPCISCKVQPWPHAVDCARNPSPDWGSATVRWTCRSARSTGSRSHWSVTDPAAGSPGPAHSRALVAMDADAVSGSRLRCVAEPLARRLAPCTVAHRLCSTAGAVSTSQSAQSWSPFWKDKRKHSDLIIIIENVQFIFKK